MTAADEDLQSRRDACILRAFREIGRPATFEDIARHLNRCQKLLAVRNHIYSMRSRGLLRVLMRYRTPLYSIVEPAAAPFRAAPSIISGGAVDENAITAVEPDQADQDIPAVRRDMNQLPTAL